MAAPLAARIGSVMLANLYRLGDIEWSRPKERPVVVVGDQGDGLWLVAPLTTNQYGRMRRGSRTLVLPTIANGLDEVSYVWSRRLHCVPDCDFTRRLGYADPHTCAAITSTCVMEDHERRLFSEATGFRWRDSA